MENDNYYVGSRGLLKSCNYFSSNPISSIRRMAFYPELKTIKHMKNPIIYVCNSSISHFNTIVPYIDFSFVLVSGDSDDTMPYDILKPDAFETFISNSFLLHWFSQNMTVDHPKITRMPIGMDYHTMCTRTIWGPITTPKNQEYLLTSIRKIPFYERFHENHVKCYANFHFQMNTKYGQDRKDAIREIPLDLVYYEPQMVTRLKTWTTQKEFAFISVLVQLVQRASFFHRVEEWTAGRGTNFVRREEGGGERAIAAGGSVSLGACVESGVEGESKYGPQGRRGVGGGGRVGDDAGGG
jgi:hypothetical protein